jgi:riboflavin kinase/FMN adenylyltransferase
MAVVATGFFDGVHLGHRLVIDTLLRAARERGEQSVIVTFWPHPRTVLQKDARELRLLSSLQEKRAMLSELGVDRVEVVPFSREFRSMTAEQYLRDFVACRLGGTAIVLGYDNRMGSDGLQHDAIVPLAQSLGLEVVTCEAVSGVYGEQAISSTKIRAALERGEVAEAEAMLGYRYGLHGVVVSGNRLGRTLGFPTANMQLYEPLKLVPGNGVYLVEVETLGGHYHGMTNVGVRPTVSGAGVRTIETHIFDFDELIYGLDIRVRFVGKIRDERRFGSLEELKTQLSADEALCRAILAK